MKKIKDFGDLEQLAIEIFTGNPGLSKSLGILGILFGWQILTLSDNIEYDKDKNSNLELFLRFQLGSNEIVTLSYPSVNIK